MSILKEKTLKNGIVGNYWKITQLCIKRKECEVIYEISLFLNQECARDVNKKDLDFKKIYSFKLLPEQLNEDLIALGYQLINDKARSMVTPLGGGPLVMFDTDLANGTAI